MNRLAWKERVGRSSALRATYVLVEGAASRVAAWCGHPFEAERRLLHAWKHVGERGLGAGRVGRALAGIEAATRSAGALRPVADNAIARDFVRSRRARRLRAGFGAFPLEHRLRLRLPRPDPDPERQGDLIVLKAPDDAPDGTTREKGVLLVMYHEAIEALPAVFDLPVLARRWQLVLETSNFGAQDARFLPYVGSDVEALVMAPRASDFAFFERLETNLVPIRLGSGEWVDPAVFSPKPDDEPFLHDVAMVASWDPLKRHATLLDAIASLRERGRRLSVVLIGVPAAWTRDRVEALVAARGLADQVTFVERVPHAEVARLVARSRAAVLLSRQEGANRGFYESLLVGTPVVVFDEHQGIDLAHVTARTGRLASDDGLAGALLDVVDGRERFDAAAVARAEHGYVNATRRVNDALRGIAASAGRGWTRDIVAKRNAPNLRYAEPGVHPRFAADYEGLTAALRPLDGRARRRIGDGAPV